MNIIPEPLSGGSRLSYDYIHHYDQVSPFYGGSPWEPAAWKQRADWLSQSYGRYISRSALAGCLRSYNDYVHNTHVEVHKSLELLEKEDALVIAGGQQSGLFTGPMLVIYKAITIIQAARKAEAMLGRPVIPVFWIAGEDHDWDEVNHTYLPARDQGPSRIRMDSEGASRTSVSYTPVSRTQWDEALKEIQQLLEDSPFKKDVLDVLQRASKHEELSGAFAQLMGELFGKHGLVLMDSADRGLRALEKPVFEQLITRSDALTDAYKRAAGELESLSYEVQAEVHPDGANLFYVHEDKRLLLFKEEGRFTDRKGLVSFSEEELLDELRAYPERFSNNVLTRPLMQDAVLPVLGTVLGQGEISYWAITRHAFQELELQMPLILPRMSFSLVSPTLPKWMDKYNVSFQDIVQGLGEQRSRWLEEQDEVGLSDRFQETKAAFTALYEPLLQDLGRLQPGLMRLGEVNHGKILEQMDYLLDRSRLALEQQHRAALRQWDCLETELMPLGRPQERVYNVFYYLNRYGMGLIDQLLSLTYDDTGQHRAVYL
ncbi:hypothetical protein E6C60_1511 [Paenibacillus algicola]|uniref:Putative cysteine ligase BshC n=1 Tax=Paenibacillus algicola TaxID=2565926 RepID=A0A4P8XI21_9BACL|nr:bacillithiol biosynthesis cysteine-adding enzyme BshC [Paenibacillus algicola]QCT02227.1 hypothetical protein E6C60_1511 [Paenibacillus algicola]